MTPGPGRGGWRALGLFWAAVILLAAAGGITLQVLGPVAGKAADHAPAGHDEGHAGEREVGHEAGHEAGHEIGHEAAPVHADPHPAAHGEAPRAEAAPVPSGIPSADPALLERSRTEPQLMLPRVAADGRAARTLYAAPVPPIPAGAKRIALLVGSFGKSERDSRAALGALPPAVSLVIAATAPESSAGLLTAARSAGHELLAAIPMEPDGYPLNDEGVHSLRTGLPPVDNRANLEWALGQTPGAAGATGASDGMRGERFAGLPAVFDPAVDEVLRRGLLYIDPRPGVPARPGTRSVDIVIDDSQARAEIESRLAALERVARERGTAIGLAGQLHPVTLDRIAAWVQGLPARGLVLVPVSSLVEPPQ